MCLTSTTVRPRLSEQLAVSLLCTGHTVCVSHPLHSDLVYPNNLVSLYSVLTILYVSHIHYTQTSFIRTTWCLSTLYWPYCMCLTSTTLRLVYPNNLVSLYSVLTILYVSHITTLRPRLSEQLGVSLLCTGHTVCVSHPLHSDLVISEQLGVSLLCTDIVYVSHIHYTQTSFIRTTWCLSTLYWPYCMCLTSTTLRPRLSEQLGVSLLCMAILYVSHIHYTQTSFIRTTWRLSTLYWPYCMCLTSTTLRPRLSEQLGVSLLCTGHTVCVSHSLQSYLVYPNNFVSLYSGLTILYVSHIHYTQTSFIRTTWCLSTLY